MAINVDTERAKSFSRELFFDFNHNTNLDALFFGEGKTNFPKGR